MVVLHGHYLGQHMFLILFYRLLKLIYQLFFLILKELGPHKGSLSSVSSGSIYDGPGSIEQPYSSGSTNLPERPGEPECCYFMHTGNCKYGSDCKYYHPKEKIAQLAASSLGPLGLPLRPGSIKRGQAVCSYYSLYGICKFGPTYKYDHPLMGYSYNYSTSLPNANANAPSLFPYEGVNSSTLHSSGSSPSKSSKNEGAKTPGGGSPSPSPQRAASPSHLELGCVFER
ncbi:unnamed protein product [Lactuca virosa]|uniref:C3H1-type domain-containing protein n=1 Tax=Lactuca virosa TaxID=75947 RepID=A0AAU9MTK6_9ASTR|nr:unnamed protein product [Lactuca virosa]